MNLSKILIGVTSLVFAIIGSNASADDAFYISPSWRLITGRPCPLSGYLNISLSEIQLENHHAKVPYKVKSQTSDSATLEVSSKEPLTLSGSSHQVRFLKVNQLPIPVNPDPKNKRFNPTPRIHVLFTDESDQTVWDCDWKKKH